MWEQALSKTLQFFHLNPGVAFFLLAVSVTVGRKVARHYWGGTAYTLADLKKYPWEAVELLLVLLAVLVSFYFLFIES